MSSNASSKNPVPVPAAKKAELYRLTNPAKVAWPTVALMLYIVVGVLATYAAALTGFIPLWAGTLLNIVFMWPVFHVAHDALHRSASSNVDLNDWIGRIGLGMVVPHVSLGVFRYSHMIHHRFTNDPQDPDHFVHGSWWTLPLRWMFFDVYYAWYNLKSGDPRGRKSVNETLPYVVVTIAVALGLTWLGYGREVLMLWLIPSRITLGLIAFTFLWLPHLDGDEHGELQHITTSASTTNNLTAGTTMRMGHESLLRPLMQWHNYHLIHHLWPTTPSYNHEKVWQLMEPELRSRDLRIQHGFDLIPTLHPGGTTAVGAS
ncbi:fatty acid desaturase [Variovorax sp. J22R115]|uniref:fatty acid desaturase n=1 Tax=Variovorax sp. J22R115 TaxID=3053509 RepID=UPI0025783678|nr:fatty acid desaturase [Variovorax sp. J22R115]MDM0047563.1 fatty acid desaturase [Variovorax sp. J22R115]